MFGFAFLLGLYANIIFAFGLLHKLSFVDLFLITELFVFCSVVFWRKFEKEFSLKMNFFIFKKTFFKNPIIFCYIFSCFGVMLMGALGPELAFDSLWYHLSLPKIYLQEHGVLHLPGGLMYYSSMPKLGELLYTSALSFSGEVLAKIIHFSFGLLTLFVTFAISRKFLSTFYSLIAVVVLLSNIVFMWEASTAYIDLVRTFFEVMAFWGLLNYFDTKKKTWLVESALLLGLAIESKLLSVVTLVVFLTLLVLFENKPLMHKVKNVAQYTFLSLLIPLGWFVFSYVSTGNPFYPLFSLYTIHVGKDTLAFPNVITDMFSIFIKSHDPISPVYLIGFPLYFIVRRNISKKTAIIFVFCLLALIGWTVTPKTGGGRFLLPYLPIFSIAAAIVLEAVKKYKTLYRIFFATVITCCLVSVVYRGVASIKYIPVVFSFQSKESFLMKQLNFQFGDFYDQNGDIKKIVGDKKVLLYGFHNLYYIDFPFIDSSWVKRGDSFEYVATQHTTLPARFFYWNLVYTNDVTGVKLYTTNTTWIY